MKFRGVKECKGTYDLSRMALVNYEKKEPIKPVTEKKSESNFITVGLSLIHISEPTRPY